MEIKFTTENYADKKTEISHRYGQQWCMVNDDDDIGVECYVADKRTKDDGNYLCIVSYTGTSGIVISNNIESSAVNTSKDQKRSLFEWVSISKQGGTYTGISQILSKLADGTEVDKITTGLTQFYSYQICSW